MAELVPCWWRDNGGWRTYQIVKPNDLTGWKTSQARYAEAHGHIHVGFPGVAVCNLTTAELVGVIVKPAKTLASPDPSTRVPFRSERMA